METGPLEAQIITFKEQPFTFIKDRRNGTKIYTANNGQSFLRLGPANAIDAELRFHKSLVEQGYPVPAIIEEGEWHDGGKYYLETSAGTEKFGTMFRDSFLSSGIISEALIDDFILVITAYLRAQTRSEISKQEWGSVFVATHFDFLLKELPHSENTIMAVWEKVKTDLADVPFVLCHGDFNAHNILPGGVIDFETTFLGPNGYDLVSAVTNIEWFPLEGDYEMLAKYSFTPEQKQRLLNLQPEASKYFDALFMLRSVWSVVRMQRVPKLQAWRYAKFQELMTRYLEK